MKEHKMNKELFDLSKMFGLDYKGYWVDESANVFSTKQGSARMLTSSGIGANKYWYFSTSLGTTSWRVDRFNAALTQDYNFIAYKERNQMNKEIRSKRYMVGSIAGASVSFAAQPKIHETEASARAECERLATVNSGKTFMYVEIKGTVKASGFTWN